MKTTRHPVRKGIAMILAMVFIVIFSAISIGFLSLSSANTQVSVNHRDSGKALAAAQSGLECAQYILHWASKNAKANGITTTSNQLTETQHQQMWNELYTQLTTSNYGGTISGTAASMNNGQYQISVLNVPYADDCTFDITFTRPPNDPNIRIDITGSGSGGAIERKIQMAAKIAPKSDILKYGLASRGRIWLSGDTTIHGSIYSSYGYNSSGDLLSMSPFNMTSDSTVEGSVNTIIPWQEMLDAGYYDFQSFTANAGGNIMLDDMKSFNSSGYLIDAEGNYVRTSTNSYVDVLASKFVQDNGTYTVVNSSGVPVLDNHGNAITYGSPMEAYDCDNNRIFGSGDELQGSYETANYNVPDQTNIPGLNIGDYNTTSYKVMANYAYTATVSGSTISNGKIPTTIGGVSVPTVTEYFPHAAGNYSQSVSGSRTLSRRKYENKTFRNVVVSGGNNALFKNCTFEEVMYVDCSSTGTGTSTSSYNNVRFENCTFNGVIVTNTPQSLTSGWWQKNCLYFTGEATFQNNSSIPEATILAPHFNVNLGNTNPDAGENNVLTGAIVGGIVDVRGNAQIYGTIISMADTSSYTSGYVTNIGATEEDGGSETTEAGDIGTIEITPAEDNLLPSGITTDIEFNLDSTSYSEPHC
jgi:Tfp pilus assembly protein PilV